MRFLKFKAFFLFCLEMSTDGMGMEMGEEQEEPDCGGFSNAEEQNQV